MRFLNNLTTAKGIIAISKGKIANVGNSGTVGVGVGLGKVEVAGRVNVWVGLQSLEGLYVIFENASSMSESLAQSDY